MATQSEHTHHIRIRSTQMEMPSSALGGRSAEEDYDRKLLEAREELERIQQQQEELERKKQELEELTSRKRAFMTQQTELSEKLTAALTLVDRQLFELRNEADDLGQCRTVFAAHLDKIQKINPESWGRDNLQEKLEKATMAIDLASDEYEQAAAHFSDSRSGAIFEPSKRGRSSSKRQKDTSEFAIQLRNGLAFNFPIIALGAMALIAYLLK